MDGYRQTLLGRALADTLQDLEQTDAASTVDGDLLFDLFDEVMRWELHNKKKKIAEGQPQSFTHGSMELTGRVTAFNRYMDDWSVQARVPSSGVTLDHSAADLHPPALLQEQAGEQEVAVRLKLRKRK